MRREIYEYIIAKKDLHQFLKEQPIWYKILSRNPMELRNFERTCKQYYKKTIPDRVEKVSNSIQMAAIMLNMLQSMNSNQ